MSKEKDLQKERINEAAGRYLCEQPSGDLYGAYNELKQVQEDGNGSALADNYVVVWQPLAHMTVDQIVEVIENSAKGNDLEDQPEFIQKINWELLKKQKKTLLSAIEKASGTGWDNDAYIDDLNGILHLIDSLQDYVVDELGVDEINVFGETRE